MHFVFFVRVSMGSVSGDYKCPLCGRKGNGGYAVDGLLCGPICTEGNYSCLRFQLCDQPYHRSAEDIVGTALYKLVKEKLPKEVCTNVVLFLKGELTAPPDPGDTDLQQEAYVSLLHGDKTEFLLYALVLGIRLKDLDATRPRILLVGQVLLGNLQMVVFTQNIMSKANHLYIWFYKYTCISTPRHISMCKQRHLYMLV